MKKLLLVISQILIWQSGLLPSVTHSLNSGLQPDGTIDTPWYVPVELTFFVPGHGGSELKRIKVLAGQRKFLLNY